jgi:hypothetical protein
LTATFNDPQTPARKDKDNAKTDAEADNGARQARRQAQAK